VKKSVNRYGSNFSSHLSIDEMKRAQVACCAPDRDNDKVCLECPGTSDKFILMPFIQWVINEINLSSTSLIKEKKELVQHQ
jgi:hypothetical protein